GGPAIGLLKTTNGTASFPNWTVLGNGAVLPTDVSLARQRIISVVPTSLLDRITGQQIILVASLDGNGILRSKDGGQTFQRVNGPSGPLSGQASDLVADPNNSQRFYAAVAGSGTFRSDNGGLAWTAIARGTSKLSRSK